MDTEHYRLICERDRSHWWYVGMNRMAAGLMKQFWGDNALTQVLDAGCGVGTALTFLSHRQRITGLDISIEALSYCQKREYGRLIQGTTDHLPLADASFDLVLCLDVLYHQAVEDDVAVLGEFARVLRPGGKLFLRVSAYNWLRGRHDTAVRTRFRYSRTFLAQRLLRAGFQLQFISYANTLLFPLAAAKRLLESFAGELVPDLALPPPLLNQAFSGILGVETKILTHSPLPFGLSLLALARKPI